MQFQAGLAHALGQQSQELFGLGSCYSSQRLTDGLNPGFQTVWGSTDWLKPGLETA
jgi:hypothetical protein